MDIYQELTLGRRVRWNGRRLTEGVVIARRAEIGPYEGEDHFSHHTYEQMGAPEQPFPQVIIAPDDDDLFCIHLNGNDILSNKLTLL